MFGGIEIDEQVHIALVIESIGEYGSKHCKSFDPMPSAQVNDSLQVQFMILNVSSANIAIVYDLRKSERK